MSKESKTPLSRERIFATEDFISRNRLSLKSQEEIIQKLHQIQETQSFMDFRPEVLIDFLSMENAKPFLNQDYVKKLESGEEQYGDVVTTIEECAQDFLDYMNFAWGKAEDERGISASRSIQKLGIWLWLMNRDDLRIIIEDDALYNPYGAPALIEVCSQMGIEVPKSLVKFSKTKCEY